MTPAADTLAVSCRDVEKHFGEGETRVQALRGVEFVARFGELSFLVGPSGCGKTTLISVIAGLLDRTGGDLLVLGVEIENTLSAHGRELRRQESLRASVAANRRALELATERYTSGLENFLAVLDAQRSVYAAEDQLVQSERNVAVALIAVYKALGGGWPS